MATAAARSGCWARSWATGARSLVELAFAWLASRPLVSSVIAGAMTPEQVDANVRAAAWTLTADEVPEVDRITGTN
jgi:aryl-alcohol dehydrogenase-like predicted oxidoreductase